MDNNINIRKNIAGLKRPGFILCFSLITGILFESYFKIENWIWLNLIVGMSILYVIFYFNSSKTIALAFFAIMIASIGGLRTKSSDNYEEFDRNMQGFYKTEVVLRGVVVKTDTVLNTPVDELGRIIKNEDSWYRVTRFVLECEFFRTKNHWKNINGKVRIKVHGKPKVLYRNTEVEVKGKLYPLMPALNPGVADYKMIFRRKGIYALGGLNDSKNIKILRSGESSLADKIDRIKTKYLRGIEEYSNVYIAQTMAALMFGEKNLLGKKKVEMFSEGGSGHILAVSGLHVGFISYFIYVVLHIFKVRAQYRAIMIILLVNIFALATGWRAPVMRASICVTIVAFGILLWRPYDIKNALAISAFIILVVRPNDIYDPGFLMSYIAVFSIVIISPKIENLYYNVLAKFPRHLVVEPWEAFKIKIERKIVSMISVGLSAWLGVMPLILYYFNILTPQAILSNLIIIPLGGIIFIIGLISFILYIIVPKIIIATTLVCSLLENLLFYSLKFFAMFSRYEYFGAPDITIVVMYYIFIVMLSYRSEFKISYKIVVTVAIVIVIAGYITFSDYRENDKVLFIGNSRCQSVLIKLKSGENILVDAGASGIHESITPFLLSQKIRTIDWLIVSHNHYDHAGEVPVILKKFRVKNIVINPPGTESKLYDFIISFAKQYSVKKWNGIADRFIKVSDTCKINFLSPNNTEKLSSNENDNSIIARISTNKFTVLFPGDSTDDVWRLILNSEQKLKSDVLVLPHHGASIKSINQIYRRVDPKYSVRCGGAVRECSSSNNDDRSNLYDASNGMVELWYENDRLKIKKYESSKN